MQKYHNTAQDKQGNIITTATITVFLANTGTPATLYKDNEIDTFNNPFDISDDNYDSKGMFFFKAENGTYDIKIVNGGDTTWIYDRVLFDFSDDTTFGGNVSLADNKSLNIGDGSDLRIRHNGTNSYMLNYTGVFNIESQVNSGGIILASLNSTGTYKAGINIGGATPYVKLYYDGSEVMRTGTNGLAFYNFADADVSSELLRFQPTDYVSGKPAFIIKKEAAAGYSMLFWDGVTTNVGTLNIGTYQVKLNGNGGVTVGSPAGGYKGLGTINAQAVYDDNTLLTDYVFDYYLNGDINPDDAKQAEQFLSNTSVLDVDNFSNHWKEYRHLPSLPSREEWEKDGAHSIGKLAQRLWETVELQAIHIDSLNIRLKELENAS